MAQSREMETEAVNADSFLDIVASVVSILIILFVMTGLRIKNTPVEVAAAASAAAARSRAALAGDLAAERAMHQEALGTARQVQEVQRQVILRLQERDMLATAVAAIQRQTEGTQEQLSTQSRQDSDLDRGILDARLLLSDLESRGGRSPRRRAAPIQMRSYPTPLSRTVEGHEIHFQLRRGRLALVPLDTLIQDLKTDFERNLYKLRDLPDMTQTVGPEGGFRMRYSVERVNTPPEEAIRTRHGGSYVRLKLWTLIPSSDDLGETLDEALHPTRGCTRCWATRGPRTPRSPSGSIRTASTPFARFARSFTTPVSRWRPGRFPRASPSPARPRAASRRQSRIPLSLRERAGVRENCQRCRADSPVKPVNG